MPLWSAVVLGAVGAVLGEIGDLSFSVIKRQTGIDDYDIFSGTWRCADRFDSVLFVARFRRITVRVLSGDVKLENGEWKMENEWSRRAR